MRSATGNLSQVKNRSVKPTMPGTTMGMMMDTAKATIKVMTKGTPRRKMSERRVSFEGMTFVFLLIITMCFCQMSTDISQIEEHLRPQQEIEDANDQSD